MLRRTVARIGVSILTRPWGRVQPSGLRSSACTRGAFQSLPARGGGCNGAVPSPRGGRRSGFNPHPPVGAGATQLLGLHDGFGGVSILTRPWGRVQLPYPCRRRHAPCGFNPHPPVGAGATVLAVLVGVAANRVSILTRPWGRVQVDADPKSSPVRCFNPHPPVGAGATHAGRRQHPLLPVSILTRPWGRVQPSATDFSSTVTFLFQSSPARGGGCNGTTRRASGCWSRFNPHPPVGAGATRLGERAGAVLQTQVFQLSRCAVPRSGRLTAGHSPTDTRYAASRPWAGCPLAPSSR